MLALDQALFALINSAWTAPWLDQLMPLVTNDKLWAPFLLLTWLWLLFGFGGRCRVLALAILVAAGAADLTSARVIKPLVNRDRPCCAEKQPRLLLDCKGSRSFPSSHAANTAAVGMVVLLETGWAAGLPVLGLAAMVSYSRVYVGVHYPGDVAAGMLLGFGIAWIVIRWRRRWWPPAPSKSPGLPAQKPNSEEPSLREIGEA